MTTRQLGQVRGDRSKETGPPDSLAYSRHVSLDRTEGTGHPEHDKGHASWDSKTGIGKLGQDNLDRKTGRTAQDRIAGT